MSLESKSEYGQAWETLMSKLEEYGVENPRQMFGEEGQDVGQFLDHFHGPEGSFKKLQELLVDCFAEWQQNVNATSSTES